MTRSLNIMVDIDEVIFPMIDSIHDLAFQRGLHDGSIAPAWSGWEVYGCTEDDYWSLWADFALSGGYTSTPPIAGAVETLRDLAFDGHQIHLVTARGFMGNRQNIRRWTPAWVAEFAVPHASLTFSQDKVAAQEVLGVQFDLAIDDSPSNFKKLQDAAVNVWLQSHPHNAWFETEFRVADLAEFAEIARDLAS